MNSEFNGRPEQPEPVRGDVLAVDGRAAADLRARGDPARAGAPPRRLRRGRPVATDMVRGINSPAVTFLYCAPHTFHQGGDVAGILRHAGPLLTHVHVADSFDHRASSGLRYILNPPGTTARIHQHLDIGQGEVPWDTLFATLERAAVRRDHDRVRVRVGGTRSRVQPGQPRGDPASHLGVGAPPLTRIPGLVHGGAAPPGWTRRRRCGSTASVRPASPC